MKRWLPLAVGVVVAVACVRLGIWQLHRLAERRAANKVLATQLADTTTIRGEFDFGTDSVVPNRAYQGTPGVWILTRLRPLDGGAVWVNRGFAPSPDGRTINLVDYREPASTTVVGVSLDREGTTVIRRLVLPAGHPGHFAAVPAPVLTDGPHLSYAIQWFAFAVIAVVGGAILGRRGTATATAETLSAPR